MYVFLLFIPQHSFSSSHKKTVTEKHQLFEQQSLNNLFACHLQLKMITNIVRKKYLNPALNPHSGQIKFNNI